jgi:hypothetical protein
MAAVRMILLGLGYSYIWEMLYRGENKPKPFVGISGP